jgi:hypothetical protein
MKIISKFTDFYDGAHGGYYDDRVLYVRDQQFLERTKVSVDESALRPLSHIMFAGCRFDYDDRVSSTLLGFCGRLWLLPASRLLQKGEEIQWTTWEKEVQELEKQLKNYRHNTRYHSTLLQDQRHLDNLWATALKFEQGQVLSDDVFRTLDTPVFCAQRNYWYGNWRFITNCRLKGTPVVELGAHQVHQQIEQYLSNQLAQPDTGPQTVGSDRDLALAKGFDDMSFRTLAPGAKKLARKQNRERKRRTT